MIYLWSVFWLLLILQVLVDKIDRIVNSTLLLAIYCHSIYYYIIVPLYESLHALCSYVLKSLLLLLGIHSILYEIIGAYQIVFVFIIHVYCCFIFYLLFVIARYFIFLVNNSLKLIYTYGYQYYYASKDAVEGPITIFRFGFLRVFVWSSCLASTEQVGPLPPQVSNITFRGLTVIQLLTTKPWCLSPTQEELQAPCHPWWSHRVVQAASPAIDVDTLGSTKVDVDGIFERSFRRPTKGLIILSAKCQLHRFALALQNHQAYLGRWEVTPQWQGKLNDMRCGLLVQIQRMKV